MCLFSLFLKNFLLVLLVSDIYPKHHYIVAKSNIKGWDFSLFSSSRPVSGLTFRSWTHFELVLGSSVRWGSIFSLWHGNTQFSQHSWKYCLFPIEYSWLSCQILVDHMYMVFKSFLLKILSLASGYAEASVSYMESRIPTETRLSVDAEGGRYICEEHLIRPSCWRHPRIFYFTHWLLGRFIIPGSPYLITLQVSLGFCSS